MRGSRVLERDWSAGPERPRWAKPEPGQLDKRRFLIHHISSGVVRLLKCVSVCEGETENA